MTVYYDTVVCTEVLEHIVDALGVLKRVPKGKRVLATVPNFYFPGHVRFFASADAVRVRSGPLFESLDVTEHHQIDDPDASHGIWFMLDGLRYRARPSPLRVTGDLNTNLRRTYRRPDGLRLA